MTVADGKGLGGGATIRDLTAIVTALAPTCIVILICLLSLLEVSLLLLLFFFNFVFELQNFG